MGLGRAPPVVRVRTTARYWRVLGERYDPSPSPNPASGREVQLAGVHTNLSPNPFQATVSDQLTGGPKSKVCCKRRCVLGEI